jgi:hypothetical protein
LTAVWYGGGWVHACPLCKSQITTDFQKATTLEIAAVFRETAMARIKIDTSKPLQLMMTSNAEIRIAPEPEVVIGLAFDAHRFATQEKISIELAMLPERAAVLLLQLQELQARGILPDGRTLIEPSHLH